MTIESRVEIHYNEVSKYNATSPIYLGLYGSQNYNLANESSDVDTKAIFLPSLVDVLQHKPLVNKVLTIGDTDEKCDVKDIREMFSNFKKQNINFLEILFTPYYIINESYCLPMQTLRNIREGIARYDNYQFVNACGGMAQQQYSLFLRSLKNKDREYNGKAICHLMRLRLALEAFGKDKSFEDIIKPPEHEVELLLELKNNFHTLDNAQFCAEQEIAKINLFRETYPVKNARQINKYVEQFLDDLCNEVMMIHLRNLL